MIKTIGRLYHFFFILTISLSLFIPSQTSVPIQFEIQSQSEHLYPFFVDFENEKYLLTQEGAFKIIESSKSCFFNILRVKNIKKKTIIDYSKEIFDSNIFENVREIISYDDIKKILKNSSFLYRIKHQNNIKNIYYKRYNRLYINKYLIKIKDFVRR